MYHFRQFFFRLLLYRRLVTVAVGASILDAVCAFGGFATLMWVIDQLFRREEGAGGETDYVTLQDLLAEKAANPRVQAVIGNWEPFVRTHVPEDPFTGFALTLGIILVAALLGASLRYVHRFFAEVAVHRAVARVRLDAFQHVIHVPWELQKRRGAYDMLSRVAGDCNRIAGGMRLLLGKSLRSVLIGTATLLLALLIDWQLTLLFLVGLPLLAVLIRKLGKRIRRTTRRALEQNAEMINLLEETLGSSHVVKAHQAERQQRRLFNRVVQRLVGHQIRLARVRAITPPATELIGMVGIMSIALFAGWYVFQQQAGATSLLKVMSVLAVSASTFRPLANLNNRLHGAFAAADRVSQLLELPTEQGGDRLPTLPRHTRSVRFERVTYHYPGQERPAVDDVDLAVDHGATVAIVGPNGSGKSTLVALLPRLIDPTAGCVRMDGTDLRTVSLRSLRSQIGVVSQDAPLFRGTIAQNIAFGQAGVDRDTIVGAATAAFAHDLIEALPHGYDTPLAEGGSGLSGGQRQRLALARAVLRDPPVLILDEATSQVDATSEARIHEALARFREERTTFIIAHRLSTVVDADRIVLLDGGRVAADGTHDHLLRTSPLYQSLSQHQLLSTDASP